MNSEDVFDPLPPLRDVIGKYQLGAKKSLGQNFLLDLNLTRRIARVAAPLDGACVYEVGPGPGGLTRALLMEGASQVIAVERDDRCFPALEDISAAFDGRLQVISEDALNITANMLREKAAGRPIKIVANLPYNVGTLLAINWLTSDWPPFFESLTLMFQREVADRLIAKPGSKAYGRLSILAQWRGTVKIAVKVPASAFTPPPKIESAVIHFTPGEAIMDGIDAKSLGRVTEAAFAQRRKMLRASLKSLVADPIKLLDAAGIEPTARAETIDPLGFCRLTKCWLALQQNT